MSNALLDEIVEKAASLSNEDRRKLIQLLHKQELEKQREEREKKPKVNNKKGYISPNTVWLKENGKKYQGLYVALKDGELIATGRTIKEADLAAKAKGFTKTLLHRIPHENEELWGGW